MIEGWRPDWRDPEQYPDPESTSMLQWAWEFLRRNPEYQKDYERWAALPTVYSDGALFEEDLTETHKGGQIGSKEQALFDALPAKYWVMKMADPAQPFDDDVRERLAFNSFHGPAWAFYHPNMSEPQKLEASEPGDVLMRFNVAIPIPVQLRRAQPVLERLQELNKGSDLVQPINPRAQRNLYPCHLRILDARAAGVSVPEIAKEIFPEANDEEKNPYPDPPIDQLIYDRLKAAQENRDFKYRLFALCEIAPTKK